MKSTGECLGISKSFDEALYKAFEGAGIRLPKHKQIIMTLADKDKQDGIDIAQRFEALGYKIYASRGTAKVLKENGVHAIQVNKIGQEAPTLLDLILEHKIDLVIDTPENGIERAKDGFLIRRYAIETGVHCLKMCIRDRYYSGHIKHFNIIPLIIKVPQKLLRHIRLT